MSRLPAKSAREIPSEDLRALTLEWMRCFTEAARAQAVEPFQALFHSEAVIFGAEKGGCIDWPLTLQFCFDAQSARIIAAPPFTFAIASWQRLSPIVGGEPASGSATLIFTFEPTEKGARFLCVHAHFSLAKTCSK